MFHVLVLFLNNLVTRQHNEVLFVDNGIEKLDQGTRVVQVRSVELSRKILLNFEQLHLCVVNALNKQIISWKKVVKTKQSKTYLNVRFRSLLLLLIQLLSSLLVCWILQVWSEKSQVLFLLSSVFLLLIVKLDVFFLHFLFDKACETHTNVVIGTTWNLLTKVL